MLAGRLEDAGVTLVRGDGRLDGPGRVLVGDRALSVPDIVVATGSEPIIPPIDGLEESGYWTNREAVSVTEIPKSLLFIGGGPVSVELGQMLRRYGAAVTIVERDETLFPREHPRLGELLLSALEVDGIDVRLGTAVGRVDANGDGRLVHLSDGTEVGVEHVVVAIGRRPRTGEIGLGSIGIVPNADGGIPVDEYLRACDGVWAIGDCVGPPFFTHRAMLHARSALKRVHPRGLGRDSGETPVPDAAGHDVPVPDIRGGVLAFGRGAGQDAAARRACGHVTDGGGS